ncbi:uncharacterized protein PHACADRAFT_142468 [Phanerochaete carnosa HHB-10118-sp]|uniref:NmrA-like domain-containing protein n=1 Tax=Phanerochaete carnosa (strain HHB-10118-sp) TaxID=650164 RepID=K5WD93_PHACS|nr:uncharacterized protein PHACADRAFT_142468 [Phanerochaete carnosa HHB-10118-sp]EKM57245.1 hypothetical protein PHACADRAFT_142468 [Phanerochaete carnosa HHB-10118-sp]
MAPKRHTAQASEKSPSSSRKIIVTAGEGQTGRLLIDLLVDESYRSKFRSLTALVFSEEAKSVLAEYEEIQVLVFDPKDEQSLVSAMEQVDTCMLIPPARKDKAKITRTLLEAAKKAKTVTNMVFLSSAGCDYAERGRQPRIREFIDLERLAMQPKSDPSTGETGHSTCVIRAGFYMENLLLYTKQAQSEGKLPIPIDPDHKFAPVALGDVVQVAAHALTSFGPHGLGDDVRGEILIVTGPMVTAGPELAMAASQALGTKMEFESIAERNARQILFSDQGAEIDEAEKEYLLEYYSLVREGKTNYVSNIPMLAYFGHRGQEPSDFFKVYNEEFKPKRRRTAKNGGTAESKKQPTRSSARGKGAKKAEDEDADMEGGEKTVGEELDG